MAKRGKLMMPCGSGKSLTAWWIAGKLESHRIVIAVPSLALIRQTQILTSERPAMAVLACGSNKERRTPIRRCP